MAYSRYFYTQINWVNKSDGLNTPLGKTNLNHMDFGIYNIAENLDVVYNELNNGKFDEANADKVIVGMPTWDSETGILTFRFYDGTEFSVDFNIEKIPVSFSMDSAGVITMTTADGTQWTADIGDVIPDYKFEDSERIVFTKTKNADGSYTIKADIKKNSITGDYLEPNYLENITTQASRAEASESNASNYADNASYDAKLAQSYAVGESGGIREGEDTDNAKYYSESASSAAASANSYKSLAMSYSEQSARYAQSASTSNTQAQGYAASASTAANTAETKASEAEASASSALDSSNSASDSAGIAAAKAIEAEASASDASNSAKSANASAETAQGYATGDTDSAKYYYEQAKAISESFSGSLRPMGTVAFANLPDIASAESGDMYNISDEFVTTSDFAEGDGFTEPAGSNVYKTADGKWDILAGTPVTGVKGASESAFRRGNVNITPENIGLGNVDNTADAEKNVLTAKTLATTRYIEGMPFNGSTNTSHYATCSTSGSTAAKTASLSNFSLVTGARVFVKFSYTNTAPSPTLNVNGTGAKTIYFQDAPLTSANAKVIYSGGMYEFVYSGSYWRMSEAPGVSLINSSLSEIAGNITNLGSGVSATHFYCTRFHNMCFLSAKFTISSVTENAGITLGKLSNTVTPLHDTALVAHGAGGANSIQNPCTCYVDTNGYIYLIPKFSDTGASVLISGCWRFST